jgi:hypothetical protein
LANQDKHEDNMKNKGKNDYDYYNNQADQVMTAANTNVASSTYDNDMMDHDSKSQMIKNILTPLDIN